MPPRPPAVVLCESRAESGEWVLFDCSNKMCSCDGMMHAECYAKLVRGRGPLSPLVPPIPTIP